MGETKLREALRVADIHRVQTAGADAAFKLAQGAQFVDREVMETEIMLGVGDQTQGWRGVLRLRTRHHLVGASAMRGS